MPLTPGTLCSIGLPLDPPDPVGQPLTSWDPVGLPLFPLGPLFEMPLRKNTELPTLEALVHSFEVSVKHG